LLEEHGPDARRVDDLGLAEADDDLVLADPIRAADAHM
jgi:hypothetical protein